MTKKETSNPPSEDADGVSAPVPASEPVPPAGAEAPVAPPRAPSRPELRRRINEALKSSGDFDKLTIDYFPDIHHRFTDGMDRVQRTNSLIQQAEPHLIVEALSRFRREGATARPPPVPPRRSLPWLGVSLSLLLSAVALVGGLFWLLGAKENYTPVGPDAGGGVPEIARFADGVPGIVLGGPWLDTDGGRTLCDELQGLGEIKGLGSPESVRCVSFHPVTPDEGRQDVEQLEQRARDAGASVVVAVQERGQARISALGLLDKDPLYGAPISVDLFREQDRKRAALVLEALAWMANPTKGTDPLDVACPSMTQDEPVDRLALLTFLVVPRCESVVLERSRYRQMCGTRADETCALGRYLEVEAYPEAPDARAILEELRDGRTEDGKPWRFQLPATLRIARADCEKGSTGPAAEALRDLSRDASAYHAVWFDLGVSAIAACVAAQTHTSETVVARRLEKKDVDADPLPHYVASLLAFRGHWRGRAGRWQEARDDYFLAAQVEPVAEYVLPLAELLLHLKQTKDAQAIVVSPRNLSRRSDIVYAALLRWAASRQGTDATERTRADELLLRLLPAGAPLVEGELDPDLQALLCPTVKVPCLYTELARSLSPAQLEALLKGR